MIGANYATIKNSTIDVDVKLDDINATKKENYGFAPINEGGGTIAPCGYESIFAWLNAQSK